MDYETAAKLNENDLQIKDGLEKARKLLKQSQKKDYYKILGVKRWVIPAFLLHTNTKCPDKCICIMVQ